MEFIDMGVTVAIVVGAVVYLIRHLTSENRGCSSCTTCMKSGNCESASPGVVIKPKN